MTYHKKLIEVALPLDAINAESAREKSIRHGHPSTLHLWWARRPLAACRAVLFASLVDDPSAHPELFPTEEAQQAERKRLFEVIEKLVKWENSTNRTVLGMAQREIARSIARDAAIPLPETPDEVTRVLREHAPPVLDPFCGGGSIPLEAQRLGLEAHGSDLNPVAVLITKALIEIPPRFAGQPPVNPESRGKLGAGTGWAGARGLAEDVRYYGKWMRDEAQKRIGHLYPKVTLPPGTAGILPATAPPGTAAILAAPDGGLEARGPRQPAPADRPQPQATVIAWLWARTVKCPNPACGARMPLVRSFWLSTKPGKKAWVEPIVDRTAKTVHFEVRTGQGQPPEPPKLGRGARFRRLVCEQAADEQHIKDEGKAGRMGAQMMAIVAEGQRSRMYLPPTAEQIAAAQVGQPEWVPQQPMANDPRNIWCIPYGLETFADLFTPRQLVALTTSSDLVGEARERARQDAMAARLPDVGVPLVEGGIGATAYAEAVATYLAFGLSKATSRNCILAVWESGMNRLKGALGLQALPMTWDYAETNPLAGAGGDIAGTVESVCEVLDRLESCTQGAAEQRDVRDLSTDSQVMVSTDPPYYDNIGYADLSDFFYVWLRPSLRSIYPALFSTLLVPKKQELIATPYRFNGSRTEAQEFFEQGLGKAFSHMWQAQSTGFPLTVYYAFKQAEVEELDGVSVASAERVSASTGWETMLEGLLRASFAITGTWPMRTELATRNVSRATNALASSIILVCRPRREDAPKTTRRDFLSALRRELPGALKTLQQGNIAPVDLAQATIGPGMAIFSRYSAVLESDGAPMRVRTALQLINTALDEVLSEQEGDFDAATRWAVSWFEQYGMNEGPYGTAETLSKAKNTSVGGMKEAGLVASGEGKVRLRRRDELVGSDGRAGSPRSQGGDGGGLEARGPRNGHGPNGVRERGVGYGETNVWLATQRLIKALDEGGEDAAARVLRGLGDTGEAARELAYRLYLAAERKGWAQEALAYNGLVIAWPTLVQRAAEIEGEPEQLSLV